MLVEVAEGKEEDDWDGRELLAGNGSNGSTADKEGEAPADAAALAPGAAGKSGTHVELSNSKSAAAEDALDALDASGADLARTGSSAGEGSAELDSRGSRSLEGTRGSELVLTLLAVMRPSSCRMTPSIDRRLRGSTVSIPRRKSSTGGAYGRGRSGIRYLPDMICALLPVSNALRRKSSE